MTANTTVNRRHSWSCEANESPSLPYADERVGMRSGYADEGLPALKGQKDEGDGDQDSKDHEHDDGHDPADDAG
jgi:hypothetical protein